MAPTDLIEGERELLQSAEQHLARLPVDQLDLLILDEMGKDISGSGMDTNVIGRLYIAGEAEFRSPCINRIVVLDLTEASHGNAAGVGLADIITERLRSKIDVHATNVNTITSTFLERGRIPIALPTDREAIEIALRCAWQPDTQKARVIRVRSTLEITEMFVSTAVWEELRDRSDMEQLGAPMPWHFTPEGDLSMPWS